MTGLNRKVHFSMFVILLIAGFLVAAGCTGEGNQNLDSEKASANYETKETLTPKETPASVEKPDTFSGSGDKKVETELTGGVHLITVEQDTPEKCVVEIQTEKDDCMITSEFNEDVAKKSMKDGKYYWTQAFMLEEAAKASVKVSTKSNWEMSFTFPEMINGIVPQTFTGTGPKATPFFQIYEGMYKFSIKTDKNKVLEVHLIDYYGNPVMDNNMEMPIAFHRGTYDDAVSVNISESCNYLLNINTDGDWTVKVEKA